MIAINVKNLLSKEVGQKIEDKFKVNFELEDTLLLEPVEIKYRLVKLEKGIIGHFYIKFVANFNCSRCLDEFELVMEKEFDRQFLLGPSKDDLPILNYQIDIQNTLREEIILSMPIRSLCSKVCKGLCPNCGKNLNVENCVCHN